jgi:FtsP/CotA-like multicopper oxidase with cupredoxin domain
MSKTATPTDGIAAPQRRTTRRTLLKAGLIGIPAAAATLAGAGGAAAAWLLATADLNTAGRVSFTNRLAIPPLAPSRRDETGRRVFDLLAAAGEHQFLPGRPTSTWGINGGYLAPTLRAGRGETVVVNLTNDLPEATALHWHGMHVPAGMDGGPHLMVEPGARWSPEWTIDQPAATLWYHPHPHERTASHTYRGIAGMFIVDDLEAAPAGLPSEYGVDDIPVIVQDKRFGGENQVDEKARLRQFAMGLLGDTVCVNGTVGPYLDVVTERIRLRLLNASNTRVYRFGLSDGRKLTMIGTDGGLLPTPYETDWVQLAPAERAEVVVTMHPRERLVLRSFPPDLGTSSWVARITGGDDTLDILELRAAAELAISPEVPAELAEPASVDTAVAVTRTFELSDFTINGESMDMSRIDFAVERDTVEVWEIVNRDGFPHSFHVHDVQFQLLTVAGAEPPPELRGWKDTVYFPPGVGFRLAIPFREYTDPNSPYFYHCHVLYHEDKAMMGQFVVVEPGQATGAIIHPGHDQSG